MNDILFDFFIGVVIYILMLKMRFRDINFFIVECFFLDYICICIDVLWFFCRDDNVNMM